MKLKILNLVGEFLDEVTGWLSLADWMLLLALGGIIIAVLVPLLVR